MKIINFTKFLSERKDTPKPKGAPDWQDSDAPDAEGRFRDLSPKDLAAWLIKTRKGELKKISGSITQQIVFNRKEDPEYAEKMEKTRIEVYKQLGRKDLLEDLEIDLEKEISEIALASTGVKNALIDIRDDTNLLDYLGFSSLKNAIKFIKFANIEMWEEVRKDIEEYKDERKKNESLVEEGLEKKDFDKVVAAVKKANQPATVMFVPKWKEIEILVGMHAPYSVIDPISNEINKLGYKTNEISIAGDSSSYSRREYEAIERINGGHRNY